MAIAGRLGLVDEDLNTCVGCGLCLPHCPTYRVSGEEAASPRGRIAAMRDVQWGGQTIDAEFVGFMDACVQCRGCETACPSGVPFGHLMEATRETLASEHRTTSRLERVGYRVLGHHRLVLAGSTLLALAQRLRFVPKRLGLPRIALRRPKLVASGSDVYLFTGCVMDAWQRETHVAVMRLMEATGSGVALAGHGGACCGALHLHAGLGAQARSLAERVMESMPGEQEIVVDSAGCGAALKEYGHLLGTVEAKAFSARVRDVHEWLASRLDRLPLVTRSSAVVAVQDPCHLRHAQRAHLAVRTVLSRYVNIVELDDEGLCCGAGGAYATTHRETATLIRDRKVASVERSGATVVASANPGCVMHLAAAGLMVRHPCDIVADVVGVNRREA
ncbi:MAG: (Fe-S)-binding protein [Acidimicrobiales bacterium]